MRHVRRTAWRPGSAARAGSWLAVGWGRGWPGDVECVLDEGGDDLGFEGFEDALAGFDFLHGWGGQGDADGVADAFAEQDGERDRGFDSALLGA